MNSSLLIIGFISISFIYAINLWFSVSGFYLFFVSFIILSLVVFGNRTKVLSLINYQTALSFCLILMTILSFSLDAFDVDGELSLAMWVNRFLMFLSCLGALTYLFKEPTQKLLLLIFKRRFLILVIISLLIQLSLLRIVKTPDVDIYHIVKNGPLKLISGENPYISPGIDKSKKFSDFHYEYYTYGPASILLFMPFDVLFKDPRYLLIISNFLIALSLYKISRTFNQPQIISQMLALVSLFHARYVNLLIYSVTDVVVVGLLSLGLLCFAYKRFYLTGIFFALLVGIKILYCIPLLFLLKYRDLPFKKLFLSGFISLLLVYLPFLILDKEALIYSTITFHLSQEHTLFLQKSVVTLASFINRQWRVFPPSYIFPLINIFIIGLLWFLIKKTKDFAKVLAAICLVFLVSLFFSFQALPGYYYVCSFFLLFALAFNQERTA